VSLFAQDDWRIVNKLMVNGGLRYDYDSKFKDNNVAPRLGLTWSPDAKTVVRANYGVYYDRYRLGIAEAVPSLGGFNGRTLVEIDYPRLATDAPLGLSRSLAAIGTCQKDPNYINTQFQSPFGTVGCRPTTQQ